MNKAEIILSIGELSYNRPIESQNKAIEKLKDIDKEYYQLLIMPEDHYCWENAALVLKNIGYPKTKDIILDLFGWIEDSNWPGAMDIIELLKTVPIDLIIDKIENIIKKAVIDHNDVILNGIELLLYNQSMIEGHELVNEFILQFKNDIYDWKKLEQCL